MPENAPQNQLYLETQSKTTIPNLIQTETLSISKFFALNGLFKVVSLSKIRHSQVRK